MLGKLYIVATPIGNLQDITLRAIDTLKTVDLIAAEDTRHSKKLLNHFGIPTPCTSFHDQNEQQKFQFILDKIKNGKTIALISDAGTPLISDPGFRLVKMARAEGIDVIPVPGCCAAIAAISASGMPCDRFYFEGFLPAKHLARVNRLTELKDLSHTIIFYESPHRILDFVEDVKTVFGEDRMIVIARELTKTFETIHQARAGEIATWLAENKEQQNGEFVVLVEGNLQQDEQNFQQAKAVYQILSEELPLKQAVKLASKITKVKKNRLYDWAVTS